MHQVGREIAAEIDSKVLMLQATIRNASREAERLEKALAQVRSEQDWGDLSQAMTQIEQLRQEIKASVSSAEAPKAKRPTT